MNGQFEVGCERFTSPPATRLILDDYLIFDDYPACSSKRIAGKYFLYHNNHRTICIYSILRIVQVGESAHAS